MAAPYYAVGNTHKFRGTITKDAAPWSLASASVSLVLIPPVGAEKTLAATVENAAGGIAYYVTVAADLNVPGTWGRYWLVADGGVNLAGPVTQFTVNIR